jgi:HPt (histidine-containing phosphotransfer) domain-containing protein
MILYSREQKFIGISDEYLSRFGYSSLSEFKHIVDGDFSDLFINRRGYISNFQYISWIEYVIENSDQAKATVRGGGGRYFEAEFIVKPFHFMESHDSGYSVEIANIVEISSDEVESSEEFHIDQSSLEPQIKKISFEDFEIQSEKETEKESQVEENTAPPQPEELPPKDELLDEVSSAISTESSSTFSEPQSGDDKELQQFEDFEILSQNEIDSLIYDDFDELQNMESAEAELHRKMLSQNSSNYSIEVMASEFGVNEPVLADFLRDFIDQVEGIKSYLYSLVTTGDIDEIRDVIHRIKGSSVNLRIEDSSNLLLKMYSNSYSSTGELKDDIDQLYVMIESLKKSIEIDGESLSKDDLAQIESSRENLSLRTDLIEKINNTGLPNNMFEDMVSDFIKIFRKSKWEIEENLNPDGFKNVRSILLEFKKMSDSLSIDELKAITDKVDSEISEEPIDFQKLVLNWLELSSYLDNLVEE